MYTSIYIWINFLALSIYTHINVCYMFITPCPPTHSVMPIPLTDGPRGWRHEVSGGGVHPFWVHFHDGYTMLNICWHMLYMNKDKTLLLLREGDIILPTGCRLLAHNIWNGMVRYSTVRYGAVWTVCTDTTVCTICVHCVQYVQYVFTYVRMYVCTCVRHVRTHVHMYVPTYYQVCQVYAKY